MAKRPVRSRDHVGRLVAKRRRETPDVPLDGMEIFGRARRLTSLSRPPIEAVFARHGIDAGEFDVLASLRRSGAPFALRPTELYRELMISSGGLTARLNRLERRGLIVRELSQADRRSATARLTSSGLALIDQAYAEDMSLEAAMLAVLTLSERRTLANLLAKLLADMERSADDNA